MVTPVYNASDCIEELYRRLVNTLEEIVDTFEIIMVNDASPDDLWEKIVSLAELDPRVKGINLSRNFGQHLAIAAGIDHAQGDWIVVMDCDLQHAPEDIGRLYHKALEGYDVVLTQRLNRKDPFTKRAASKAFAFVYNWLSDVKLHSSVSNFSVISKQVADTLRCLRERNRSYILLLLWLGFDAAYVDVEHAKRFSGKSSYTFSKSLNFAIESIASQSNRPLRLSIKFGFLLSSFSLLSGVSLILRYFATGIGVEGWTSVMVSLFFIGGLLFANIGLLGLYLGKVFDETKNRPLYVVQQSVNWVASDSKTTDIQCSL